MDVLDYLENGWFTKITEPDWKRKIEEPESLDEYFSALRAMYKAADNAGIVLDSYPVDWLKVFTPIEYQVWCDIRCAGLPFCPQYPVGRYFVDFADPVKRIAIECDGKQWHDEDKDRRRDQELWEKGWLVIRFPGSECNRCSRPDEDEVMDFRDAGDIEGLYHRFFDWMNTTSEGGVEAIKAVFYEGRPRYMPVGWAMQSIEERLLVGAIDNRASI